MFILHLTSKLKPSLQLPTSVAKSASPLQEETSPEKKPYLYLSTYLSGWTDRSSTDHSL
jgi:hypothetical protein